MHKFQFFEPAETPTVLCIGAHADDIEIGCGGTVLKLVEAYPKARFFWIVFSGEGEREIEARKSAALFLGSCLKKIDVQHFRDSYFPSDWTLIKDYFVMLKKELAPDLVLTHYSNDAHQDHRLISQLTWNAFRDNFILEYEIPKYDGDLGTPNFYVHIKETIAKSKVNNVYNTFKSQNQKLWFDTEGFLAIMRLRGIESNSLSKFAEAFYCKKIVA